MLVTRLAVVTQGAGDDGVKAGVDPWHTLGRQLKHALRQVAGEHLVEHHPHGINVGSVIHLHAECERLRSHEMQRAQRRARTGEAECFP